MILPHDPNSDDDAPTEPRAVAWAPFDPGDAPELPVSDDGTGRIVAVIASVELVGVGWAVAVASELARVWAAQRPGVVLVDTDLARPRLHHAVRVDNAVGLAEVLRGEAPVAGATRVVDEDRLFCVPAGNAPEDPVQGFHAGRWVRLCEAFSGAGVTVVAYVPASATWIRDVLDTATDVVELTEQHHSLDWPREGAPPVRAVLGPMPLAEPPADPTGRRRTGSAPLLGFDADHPEEGADRHEEDAHRRDDAAVLGGPGTDEDVAVTADVLASRPSASAAFPGRPRSARAGRPAARSRATVLALIVVVALAAWAAVRLGSGSAAPPPDAAGSPADAAPTGVDIGTVPPRPVPPNADFSVAVASYSNAARAEQRRGRLAADVPALPWFVAPVEIDGVSYHRVMGGLVADSAAALTLGAELARDGDIGQWLARPTGWVVDFGEHAEREAAELEVARIRERGIPAQLAEIRFTDQTVRYRVYAGGYRDAEEASYLLGVAEAAGLTARPARREGRPPG